MLALKSKSFALLLAAELACPKPNAPITMHLMAPAPAHNGLAGKDWGNSTDYPACCPFTPGPSPRQDHQGAALAPSPHTPQ